MTLDENITMLRNVLDNLEGLTSHDIEETISVAYKAVGMAATMDTSGYSETELAKHENACKELKDIMAKLKEANEVAKANEAEKSAKEPKEKEEKAKNIRKTSPKKEKALKSNETEDQEKPTLEESSKEAKPEEKPEVKEVKEVTSSTAPVIPEFPLEEKQEELRNVTPPKEEVPLATVPELPTPKEEVKASETPKVVEKKIEEKKEVPVEIVTPEVQENVIVIDAEKLEEEKKNQEEEAKNELKKEEDNVEFLESLTGPFKEDNEFDDIEEEIVKEDHTKVGADSFDNDNNDSTEEFSIETEEERLEREKKLEEEFSTLPKDFELRNIKDVSRTHISDTLKMYAKANFDKVSPENISVFDYNAQDENMVKDYIKTYTDTVASPKVSRVYLLMSGHYEEINAYGNFDLIEIARSVSNPDLSFAQREQMIYQSIYNHVKNVSYSKTKPDFEEWSKNILFPDVKSLFYGAYDANSSGKNQYTFDCPFCSQEISETRANRDLSVAVPKELTKDKLTELVTSREIRNLDYTDISKWARNTIVKKKLPITNFILEYKIPTLYEYLQTITTATRITSQAFGSEFDVSVIDNEDSDDADISDLARMKAYLYINKISVPSIIGNTKKIRYIGSKVKADIIGYVNGFDIQDYNAIFEGNDVSDIMVKNAMRFYLTDVTCPHCGKVIKYISINPKQIFFFRIGEARRTTI